MRRVPRPCYLRLNNVTRCERNRDQVQEGTYYQFLAGHKEKAPAAETSQEVSMKPLPGWTRTRGSGFDQERDGHCSRNQRRPSGRTGDFHAYIKLHAAKIWLSQRILLRKGWSNQLDKETSEWKPIFFTLQEDFNFLALRHSGWIALHHFVPSPSINIRFNCLTF